MGFTCDNEIEIYGGSEDERRRVAALILALDSVDEDSSSREERGQVLLLRFKSVDGLPESELAGFAAQFSSLSFTLVYFSLDGEFFGYAKAGAAGDGAESEDFADGTRETVGKDHDGDGIAFVRSRYALPLAE
jgi:hypothetical protein